MIRLAECTRPPCLAWAWRHTHSPGRAGRAMAHLLSRAPVIDDRRREEPQLADRLASSDLPLWAKSLDASFALPFRSISQSGNSKINYCLRKILHELKIIDSERANCLQPRSSGKSSERSFN